MLFYIKISCLLSSLVICSEAECKGMFGWERKALLQSQRKYSRLKKKNKKKVAVGEDSTSLCILRIKDGKPRMHYFC